LVDPDIVDWRVFGPLLVYGPWICGQNLKYECRILLAAGLRLPEEPRFFDVGIAARLLMASAIKPPPPFQLEDLASRYCGLALDKAAQLTFRHGPKTETQREYAARDALVCLHLWREMTGRLLREGLGAVATEEMAAICSVAWLEDNGAPIDPDGWRGQAQASWAERRALDERLSAISGKAINWNAPPQVARVLQERGHTLPSTKKGTPQTGRPALYQLPEAEPLRTPLIEYSLLKSRTTTYGEDFLRHIHPVTGRLHGDWHQLVETGRMSCTGVPLQGIPRQDAYRSLIRPEEGLVLVKGDWGHIEFDLAAQIAGDERAIALLLAGEDPHYRTAAQLLGKPIDAVTKAERQMAKPVNFGLIYSMGPAGLSQSAKESYGLDLPLALAKTWRRKFFRYYWGLKRWHDSIPDGAIATRTVLGRRRLAVSVFGEKANTPVQGSGADALKIALGMLWRRRHLIPRARLILASHDELVLECPQDDAPAARALLAAIMRESMARILTAVPPVVECAVFRDWGVTPVDSERLG
jgi:DNA polymerase-1